MKVYYFKPIQFYNFFRDNVKNKETRDMLGDEMFFSLLSRCSGDATVFDYTDGESKYSFSSNGLFKFLTDLNRYVSNLDYEIDLKEKVVVKDNRMTVKGNSYLASEGFITNFLTPEKEYKDVTYSQMNLLGESNVSNSGSIVVSGEETLAVVETEIKKKEDLISNIEQELKTELEKLKEEFELRISKAKLDIANKISPLVTEIEKMTDKLTVMESSLYRWLSYNGESYELKKLCEGSEGSVGEKFVIWQKLRYLDEELPKLLLDDKVTSDVDFQDFNSLENLMFKYKVVRDFFIPSQKGCIVFQLSRSSVKYFYYKDIKVNPSNYYSPWLEYIKQSYLVENWNKLGMFIKNGDNLYVLWLDADKINISSDNLFLSKNSTEVTEVKYDELRELDEYDDKSRGEAAMDNIKRMKKNYSERRSVYSKHSSRVYMIDILQGIIDNMPTVLGLEGEQNVFKALSQGSYRDVVFNNVDGYLTHKKWNSASEIFKEVSAGGHRVGDPIYVTTRGSGRDRGRVNSYLDFTSDATLEVGLTKINLIDYEDTYVWSKVVCENMLEWSEKKKAYVLKSQYDSAKILTSHKEVDNKGEAYKITSNYIEHPETIEGWMTDNLGEAPLVVYSIKTYKETKRIDEPDVKGGVIYEKVYNNWTLNRLIYLGFVENKSLRKRVEYLYVSCEKTWSYGGGRANVMIYEDEFVPLKNMKLEHVNYMINHSMTLPGRHDYSDSIKVLLDVRKYIQENKK